MASDCVPPDKGMARSTLDSMLLAADSHVSKHTLKMPWEKGSMKAIFDARPNLMPAMPVIQAPLQSEPLDSSTFEEAAVKAQPPVSVSSFLAMRTNAPPSVVSSRAGLRPRGSAWCRRPWEESPCQL